MKTVRHSTIALGLIIQIFTASCGSKIEKKVPRATPADDPSPSSAESFSLSSFVVEKDKISSTESSPNSKFRLGLNREGLGKEFLLRANVVQGSPSAMFSNLKSRIVVFKLSDDRLYMIEASAGHILQGEVGQELVLAEFPLLSQNQQVIFFDFNRGMKKLYTMQDWYAQDLAGDSHPSHEAQFGAIGIDVSFLKDISVDEANMLQLTQVAQLRSPKSFVPAEVHYHLAPYQPAADFKPSPALDKERVGFFEVTPEFNQTTGRSHIHSSKFNSKHPIEFAISANTPAEFRDSIREGILYWNKAFGRDVLTVVDAPVGAKAPNYSKNIVQWVDWKDAGFAYADAQMDPRTGEVLNAQIYLTSAFTHLARRQTLSRQRSLLPSVQALGESAEDLENFVQKHLVAHRPTLQNYSFPQATAPDLHQHFGLTGSLREPLCQHEEEFSFNHIFAAIHEYELSEQEVMGVVQDYLRHVVAHEVGHTLGLRHNFAGHHRRSYSLAEKKDLYIKFFKGEALPENLVVSSSVMDYLPFEDAGLSGRLIKKNPKAFTYDEKALEILYEGKTLAELSATLPLFCTDSHVATYVDCRRFSSNASPLASAKYDSEKAFSNLPYTLLDYFIANAKAPEPGVKAQPFDSIKLGSVPLALSLLGSRMLALKTLVSSSRALWIDRAHGRVTNTNRAELTQKYGAWVTDEVVAAGGWSKILDHFDGNFATELSRRFNELVELHKTGKSSLGTYEFSLDELAAMKTAVASYGMELEKSLQIVSILQLASIKDISGKALTPSGFALGDSFADYLAKRAATTALARTATPLKGFYQIKMPIKLTGIKAIAVYHYLADKHPELLNIPFGSHEDSFAIDPSTMQAVLSKMLHSLLEIAGEKLDIPQLIKEYKLDKLLASAPAADAPPTDASLHPTAITVNPAPGEAPAAASSAALVTSTRAINVMIPLNLANFRHSYIIRALSLLLLSAKQSQDLSFATRHRQMLREIMRGVYTANLRGLNILKLPYENQGKITNVWLQENRLIMNALGESEKNEDEEK